MKAHSDEHEEAPPATPAESFEKRLWERYLADAPGPDPAAGPKPRDIPRYVVGEEVARGGMGAIFRAWDQDIERPLAMKVILGGDSSDERTEGGSPFDDDLLARFVREAKVTGQLDHPGIVPVHDIGVDGDGRVYFTMRLVQGRNLNEVFRAARSDDDDTWNLSRALEALLKVCDTVAFAHSKGVVHRDLKPANIMVGEFGEVYVLDWGLAKLIADEPGDSTVSLDPALTKPIEGDDGRADATSSASSLTLPGSVMGTPAYMAPEQARGDHHLIGPQTDVYAIGAMLYSLLAGRAPYLDPESSGDAEALVARVVDGPPAPIHSIDAAAPDKVAAICERAMARDGADRYPSPTDMAQAIRDTMEEEFQATIAADRARAEAQRAEEVASFLTGLFQARNLKEAHAENLTVLDVLEHGRERLASGEFDEQPTTRGALQFQLAEIYNSLGSYPTATELYEASLEESRSRPHADDPELARRLNGLASNRFARGDYPGAESLLREIVELRRNSLGSEHPLLVDSLIDLTRVLVHLQRNEEAVEVGEQALAIARRICDGPEHTLYHCLNHVGMAFWKLGRPEKGEPLLREALPLTKAAEDRLYESNVTGNLGLIFYDQAKHEEARSMFREAVRLTRERVGDDHPVLATVLNNLAMSETGVGNNEEAVRIYEHVIELRRRALGRHPRLAHTLQNYAVTLEWLDRLVEAREAAEEALELFEETLPKGHPQIGLVLHALASIALKDGRADEGIDYVGQAIALFRELVGGRDSGKAAPAHEVGLAKSLGLLGRHRLATGDVAAAHPLLEESIAIHDSHRQLARDSFVETRKALEECRRAR